MDDQIWIDVLLLLYLSAPDDSIVLPCRGVVGFFYYLCWKNSYKSIVVLLSLLIDVTILSYFESNNKRMSNGGM
jgi:hypothetical protein